MPIKGLTDRKAKRDIRSGRMVRLGTIGKGERTGFGTNIKLHDRDYFVFKPAGGDKQLAELFEEAYGPRPAVIPDVRIPVGLAGNFNIEDCAWLTASRHTERGSIFMARSDGVSIKQSRNSENGKVEFHYDGEMPHDDNSAPDNRGKPGFVYKDNVYTWTQSFAIDLILPDFNRICFENNAAGMGVVTLLTHSTYDISTLIGEYNAILDELASLFTNPLVDSYDHVRSYLPLRDFPLRLYRSTDKITTPDYRKDAVAGSRLTGTRSLLHWQLNPALSAGIQIAIDRRTSNLIAAVGQAPQLTAKSGNSLDNIEGDANDILFGKVKQAAPPPRQITASSPKEPPEEPPEDYEGVDWEEVIDTDVEEGAIDAEIIEGNVEELDSQVEDAREWLKEKIQDGKLRMTLIVISLTMTPFYVDADNVKAVIESAPEFEEMRVMGLNSDLRKKYTAAGGIRIFDIAVSIGTDSMSEEE